MRIRKLESTDAFVAVDADGAPGQGVVRLAPKVLQGGAKDLARSVTYTLACLGRRETGISAGINAPSEEASDAVAAFIAEVSDWDGGYRFGAGTGVDAAALGPLGLEPADPLPAAVAAAMAARPDASTAAVLNDDPEALAGLLAGHGVEVVDGDPRSAGVDLLFTAGKPGTIDHATAEGLAAAVVIPTSRLVVGTRALSTCARRGIVVLPDFAILDTPADESTRIVGEVLGDDEGPVLGACERAEAFLGTWMEALPFGRPI